MNFTDSTIICRIAPSIGLLEKALKLEPMLPPADEPREFESAGVPWSFSFAMSLAPAKTRAAENTDALQIRRFAE
jgi:hypothetical protein